MLKSAVRFFDRLEDRARHLLSKHPIFYAFIAGFAVVLFWRGVWTFADLFSFMTPLMSIIVSVFIMLITGTFVSFFIGEQLLLSGLKEEKRIDQKTRDDIKKEEERLRLLALEIDDIKRDVSEMKEYLKKISEQNKVSN